MNYTSGPQKVNQESNLHKPMGVKVPIRFRFERKLGLGFGLDRLSSL